MNAINLMLYLREAGMNDPGSILQLGLAIILTIGAIAAWLFYFLG